MPTNTFKALQDLFSEFGASRGATKTAEAMSETGSRGGETTHPIKNVDDHDQKVETGARAAENTADVKANVTGPAIDEIPDAGFSESFSEQLGQQPPSPLQPKPTGMAPEVEDNYDDGIQDPGTSSVMTTDDGKKYAAWTLRKIAEEYGPRANGVLAAVVKGDILTKEAAQKQAASTPGSAEKAAAAGYAAAESAGAVEAYLKQAAATIINEAAEAADLTGQYLVAVAKQADDASAAGPAPGMTAPVGPDAGPGGAPGGDPSGGDPSGGDPVSQLLAIIQSLPPEAQQELIAALSGGAGPGGDPTGGAGPGGEPPVDSMSHAMADADKSPDDLDAAATKAGAAEAALLRKIAQSVRARRQDPKFYHKEARTEAVRSQREQMQSVLAELLGAR